MEGVVQVSTPQPVSVPRILVALDGSAAAKTALPVARAAANQLHAHLTILHIAPTRLPAEVWRQRLGLGPEDLTDADVHLHQGDPAAGILLMMDDPRVLLTVLTTHGRNIEPNRHLGRVAESVIAATRGTMLIVRPEAVDPLAPPVSRLQSLLFPLDGTPTTVRGIQPAADLASKLQASVDLLYVASPTQQRPTEVGSIGLPWYVDQPQHEWPEWVSDAVERLAASAECPKDVPVRAFLAYGSIEEEILRFAVTHQEDVIVLVRRSQMEPGRARVLRAVLDKTPCPVLFTGLPRIETRGLNTSARSH
jgi:nucleotide-binding universal stress UspA family protein